MLLLLLLLVVMKAMPTSRQILSLLASNVTSTPFWSVLSSAAADVALIDKLFKIRIL